MSLHRALLLSLVVLVGCTDDNVLQPLPPTVVALYGEAATTRLTPFPSDRYATLDPLSKTGLRVRIDADTTADELLLGLPSVAAQLSEMDGFSTTGGVVLSFSGPIDVDRLVPDEEDPSVDVMDASAYTLADTPLMLLNVDPNSPGFGRAHGLIPRYWEQPQDDYYLWDEFTLVVHPARPLLPKTRYLFVATDQLRSAGGSAVRKSPDTEHLLSSPATNHYEQSVLNGLDVLEQYTGITSGHVVVATVFTTASIVDETAAMAEAARARPAPAISSPWEVETPMSEDGHIRYRATFEAPEYRKPKPDGKWEIEAGAPVVQQTADLEIFLSFADGRSSGPRPVVIYQHGLAGNKDSSGGTAGRLRALNPAVLAIDSPEHGSRGDGEVTAAFSFFGIDSETQSFDIEKARDNFRQMASDQLELVRLIRSLGELDLLPEGAPDGVPDLDVSRILYIGHSFGSVQGPTIFALAPEIEMAVWNVGGAGLMMLLRDSPLFSILVNALRPPGVSDGGIARFFAVAQALVDPGDPLNYARFGVEEALDGVADWHPRSILLQEVVADSIVPNSTTEALARALGLTNISALTQVSGLSSGSAPIAGNGELGATLVLSQFDTAGGKLATHGELIFTPEAIGQYGAFFQSGLDGSTPTVIASP